MSTEIVSSEKFRAAFHEYINRAHYAEDVFIVQRRKKPMAVVMSIEEWELVKDKLIENKEGNDENIT